MAVAELPFCFCFERCRAVPSLVPFAFLIDNANEDESATTGNVGQDAFLSKPQQIM